MNNVFNQIVKKDLCCGCGICASVIKKCNLKIVFNKKGELIPEVTDCNNCGSCLSVCPFFIRSDAKITENTALGSFVENYVGYSKVKNERLNSSSGGLVTRLLNSLLERKLIDGAIVVGSSARSDRFFEPFIALTPEDISSAAGSKYYPVEFSMVLQSLKNRNGRYALVGLPCVISGIKLLQQKYPLFGKKIKYLFGLTCGHNKNKNYTNFLLNLIGSRANKVSSVKFRSKEGTGKATNFGFKGIKIDGTETKQLNFQDTVVNKIWGNWFFALGACFSCKDLFAKNADISFMDAWLDKYTCDSKGNSIIVIRNQHLKQIFLDECSSGRINAEIIMENDVLFSQQLALKFKMQEFRSKANHLFVKWFSNRFFLKSKNRIFGLSFLLFYLKTFRLQRLISRNYYLLSELFNKGF